MRFPHLIRQLNDQQELELLIRVIPNAPQTELREEMSDGTFKIAVAAPPEKGKANKELIGFLSTFFGVPRSTITMVFGQASRVKKIKIRL